MCYLMSEVEIFIVAMIGGVAMIGVAMIGVAMPCTVPTVIE